MFDVSFAGRLLQWSTRAICFAFFLLVGGVVLAYGLGYWLGIQASMGWQMVGHYLIGSGAMGIKVSYIARLAALDVLSPDPEGWPSELQPGGTGPVAGALPAPARKAA